MENIIKLVGFLILFVISFFASIYITAPIVIDIYNILMFKYTGYTLTVPVVLGVILFINIVKYRFTKNEDTILIMIFKFLSYYAFLFMIWGIAHLYTYFI